MCYHRRLNSERIKTYSKILLHLKTCLICNSKIYEDEEYNIDHIIPLVRGGSWQKTNLAISHKQCNIKKNFLTLPEFKVIQLYYNDNIYYTKMENIYKLYKSMTTQNIIYEEQEINKFLRRMIEYEFPLLKRNRYAENYYIHEYCKGIKYRWELRNKNNRCCI